MVVAERIDEGLGFRVMGLRLDVSGMGMAAPMW